MSHRRHTSLAESFLCWLLKYGHLLSPSKVRRLIQSGEIYDSAILGGLIEFLIEKKIHSNQWKIILPYCKKRKQIETLLHGPNTRVKASYFLKYRIAAPNFQLDTNKFLYPESITYTNCLELKNRALFGSVVNADLASYLKKHPNTPPYQVSKYTHHHKARIFDIYEDVVNTMSWVIYLSFFYFWKFNINRRTTMIFYRTFNKNFSIMMRCVADATHLIFENLFFN